MEHEVRSVSMCNVAQALEEKGIERGLEQVAINMIHEGMDDNIINKMTKLSLERIAELREQESCFI